MEQTTKTQGRPAFTFEAPGTMTDEDITRSAVRHVEEPLKKTGLVPMAVDSLHRVPIRGEKRPAFVTAKDRERYPGATGFYFCKHPGCKDQGWEKPEELRAAEQHRKTPREFAEAGETHLIGFWATSDIGGPEEECDGCKKATAAAAKEKEGAVKACRKHARGPIGLLTPGELR